MGKHQCDAKEHLKIYWVTMHTTAAFLPQEPTKKDRQNFWNFLEMIGKILPCQDPCGKDWLYRLHSFKPKYAKLAKTRSSIFQMVFNIHNVWNACLDKPLCSWEEAVRSFPHQNLIYDPQESWIVPPPKPQTQIPLPPNPMVMSAPSKTSQPPTHQPEKMTLMAKTTSGGLPPSPPHSPLQIHDRGCPSERPYNHNRTQWQTHLDVLSVANMQSLDSKASQTPLAMPQKPQHVESAVFVV